MRGLQVEVTEIFSFENSMLLSSVYIDFTGYVCICVWVQIIKYVYARVLESTHKHVRMYVLVCVNVMYMSVRTCVCVCI